MFIFHLVIRFTSLLTSNALKIFKSSNSSLETFTVFLDFYKTFRKTDISSLILTEIYDLPLKIFYQKNFIKYILITSLQIWFQLKLLFHNSLVYDHLF